MPPSAPTLRPAAALLVAVAVLTVANLLNNRVAPGAYLPTSVLATVVLLLVFRLAGPAWTRAGLGRDDVPRGLRWALLLAGAVALGYLLLASLPATRQVFLDRRVGAAGLGAALYQVLVRIPFGTVLLEEVAFRGVLFGLLRDWHGTACAVAVSSALFGLWHILPASSVPALNPSAGAAFHGRALWMIAAVAGTALAGAVLCEVSRRSGSLLAPIGLHWATNALGYLVAWWMFNRCQ